MITAKNYVAQAARGLVDYMNDLVRKDVKYINDAATIGELSNCIQQAQHFAVPDGGKLLEMREFSSLLDIPFRLPYPIITLEFYEGVGDKRLILAREGVHEDTGEHIIAVNTIMGKGDRWAMSPLGAYIDISKSIVLSDDKKSVVVNGFECTPTVFEDLNNKRKLSQDDIRGNVTYGVIPLCEFIAALSCTNVGTETHQEAYRDNTKRIKQGKLPIYETKTLTLNVTKPGKGSGSGGGGSSTPKRQHFRRGYIRHLASGNYWVNACIVGKNRNGFVDKDYIVR